MKNSNNTELSVLQQSDLQDLKNGNFNDTNNDNNANDNTDTLNVCFLYLFYFVFQSTKYIIIYIFPLKIECYSKR